MAGSSRSSTQRVNRYSQTSNGALTFQKPILAKTKRRHWYAVWRSSYPADALSVLRPPDDWSVVAPPEVHPSRSHHEAQLLLDLVPSVHHDLLAADPVFLVRSQVSRTLHPTDTPEQHFVQIFRAVLEYLVRICLPLVNVAL
jgi:hypothetical protein